MQRNENCFPPQKKIAYCDRVMAPPKNYMKGYAFDIDIVLNIFIFLELLDIRCKYVKIKIVNIILSNIHKVQVSGALFSLKYDRE